MERVVFVETLDRWGRVKLRVRLNSLPINIGRSYTNDVILDGRFVSPEHAQILEDEQGRLVAVDLDSTNGLFVVGTSERVSRVVLSEDTDLRIGRMRIRVRTPESVVAPVWKEEANGPRGGRFGTPLAGVAALATTLLALSLNEYLASYERVSLLKLTSEVMPIMALVAIWAGGWSFASRVVAHEFRFISHWVVACTAAVSLLVLVEGEDYYSFFFNAGFSETVLDVSIWTLLMGLLLYGHLRLVSQQSRRFLVGWAVGLAIVVQGFLVFDYWVDKDDFTTDREFPHQLKPVSTDLLYKSSVDDFLVRSAGLKDEVDSLAEEELY
jgi:hypothetical protein